jgi:hypothetical protein
LKKEDGVERTVHDDEEWEEDECEVIPLEGQRDGNTSNI